MSITCPDCQYTSHHPDDERYGYCGHCHRFTSPTTEIPQQPRRCWQELTATGHLCLTELIPAGGLPGWDLCPHCGTWWGPTGHRTPEGNTQHQ